MNTYLFENQRVVIVHYDLVPAGITPIKESDVHALILAEYAKKVGITDTCFTLDDAYSAYSGENPIVLDYIRNPENEQKLSFGFVTEAFWRDDLISRELLTKTTRYHDWDSRRFRFIEKHSESTLSKEEALAEWQDICSEFKPGLSLNANDVDFDEIWDEIEYSRELN